jgi:chromosome segregation ATPase
MCQRSCCANQHETHGFQPTPALAEEHLAPVVGVQIGEFQTRLDDLVSSNELLKEHVSNLDKKNEERNGERQEMLTVMKEVMGGISDVQAELARQQDQFSAAQTRLTSQREQNDRNLADVERHLNDLLSKLEHRAQ